MRLKTVLFILFAICFIKFSSAQTGPTGVYGIPFGVSDSKVISAMKDKKYTKHVKTTSGYRQFQKVNFGAFQDVTIEYIYTDNNKLYKAYVWIYPEYEPDIVDLYDELVIEFSKKYTEGTDLSKYKDNNKNVSSTQLLKDITDGETSYGHVWRDKKGGVQADIIAGKRIRLIYLNFALEEEQNQILKKKNAADY